MSREVQAIIDDLNSFQFGPAALQQLYSLAEEIDSLGSTAVIPAILQLFERFPHEDFGAPGPLAHAAESYYQHGYEEELLQSLRRKPTELTLWLANRIVNAKNSEAQQFIELLREIGEDDAIEEHVRTVARDFAALHQA